MNVFRQLCNAFTAAEGKIGQAERRRVQVGMVIVGLLGVIKYLSVKATRIMVAVGGFGLKKCGGAVKWSLVNFSSSPKCGLQQKFGNFLLS